MIGQITPGPVLLTTSFMNINKQLSGLNRRIQRLRFKENPPTLKIKFLNQQELEQEQDINDEYCLIVRIEEKSTDLFSSRL